MTGHDRNLRTPDRIRPVDSCGRQSPQRLRAGERGVVRGLRRGARRPGRTRRRRRHAGRRRARRCRSAIGPSSSNPIDDIDASCSSTSGRSTTPGRATPFLLDSAWPTPDLGPIGFAPMGHPPLMVRPAGVPFAGAAAGAPHRARRRRPHRVRLRAHADLRLSRAAAAADDARSRSSPRRRSTRRAGITSSATSTTSR